MSKLMMFVLSASEFKRDIRKIVNIFKNPAIEAMDHIPYKPLIKSFISTYISAGSMAMSKDDGISLRRLFLICNHLLIQVHSSHTFLLLVLRDDVQP